VIACQKHKRQRFPPAIRGEFQSNTLFKRQLCRAEAQPVARPNPRGSSRHALEQRKDATERKSRTLLRRSSARTATAAPRTIGFRADPAAYLSAAAGLARMAPPCLDRNKHAAAKPQPSHRPSLAGRQRHAPNSSSPSQRGSPASQKTPEPNTAQAKPPDQQTEPPASQPTAPKGEAA